VFIGTVLRWLYRRRKKKVNRLVSDHGRVEVLSPHISMGTTQLLNCSLDKNPRLTAATWYAVTCATQSTKKYLDRQFFIPPKMNCHEELS
jgi:hypothetical protein